MTLTEKQENLKRDFSQLSTWEEKYRKIIEMGNQLPPLDPHFQTDNYRVKGCQSQVWLVSEKTADGKLLFHANSDALISRGLIAILLYIYSEARPEDILTFQPTFLADLQLTEHLSPSRANGLLAMLKQIIIIAARESSVKGK